MFKRVAHRRWITWLALAAMAFIVVVPVISRALPMQATMSDMAADCMMGAAHADHHHATSPADPNDPTVRCSYCCLLAHTPLVTFDVGIALVPSAFPSLSPQAQLPRSEPAAPILSAAPRGPPSLA